MNARFYLRDATRAAHQRTDIAFSALDLAQRHDYGVFLGSHFLAYRAMMPVFEAGLPAAQRPPAMADLLADDLHTLGFDTHDMTEPHFTGDALGAAYVVAGSHFGQRVLCAQHRRSDDPIVRDAERYLASPALKLYWPVLKEAIEQVIDAPDGPDRLKRLTLGAEATFALFAECLTLARAKGADHELA